MFKDLDWKGAVKRAALTVLIYLGLVYVLNVALPGTSTGILPTALNAALLFVVFTFFHAFVERRKKRQKSALRSQGKEKTKNKSTTASDTEEDEGGVNLSKDFKGRRNPNTSRRKASRRRR